MDVLIKDGDTVLDSSSAPLYTEGAEEVLQRVELSLSIPKGSFIYNRSLGVERFDGELSERGIRRLEARCREAVMNIEGAVLSVLDAERTDSGRIKALIKVDYQGEEYKREVII